MELSLYKRLDYNRGSTTLYLSGHTDFIQPETKRNVLNNNFKRSG